MVNFTISDITFRPETAAAGKIFINFKITQTDTLTGDVVIEFTALSDLTPTTSTRYDLLTSGPTSLFASGVVTGSLTFDSGNVGVAQDISALVNTTDTLTEGLYVNYTSTGASTEPGISAGTIDDDITLFTQRYQVSDLFATVLAGGAGGASENRIAVSTDVPNNEYLILGTGKESELREIALGYTDYDLNRVITTNMVDLSGIFQGITGFNQSLNTWDISNATSTRSMFDGATSFNNNGSPSISFWNVSNVTDFSNMFLNATSFDQDISNWDVISAINMSGMFQGASVFNNGSNTTGIDTWDVSNVTNMSNMFSNSNFNRPIDGWNTVPSIVTNVVDFTEMFSYSPFNQDLTSWAINITSPASVTMRGMFEGNTDFNGDITTWNTSYVTDMSNMFRYATSFDQNIGGWNVSNVTAMSNMFNGATSFNNGGSADINTWLIRNVTTMEGMFRNASSFNQDIGDWDFSPGTFTPNIINMINMFNGASVFDQDISSWDILTNIPEKPTGFDIGTLASWLETEKPWEPPGPEVLPVNISYSIDSCYNHNGTKYRYSKSYDPTENAYDVQTSVIEAIANFIRIRFDPDYEVPAFGEILLFYDSSGETDPNLDLFATTIQDGSVTDTNIKDIVSAGLYNEIRKFIRNLYLNNKSSYYSYSDCKKSLCIRVANILEACV